MSDAVVRELDRIGRDVTSILDRIPAAEIPESALPHLQHLPRIATALERIAVALEKVAHQ